MFVSAAVILSFGYVLDAQADPPATNMVLWLKADAGVMSGGGAASVGEMVDQWQDQSGNSNNANLAIGDPILQTAGFPNGSHNVIRFNGDDGFELTNEAPLRLTNFRIFIVNSYDADGGVERIFGNYSVGNLSTQYGYALGTKSDGGGAPMWWYYGSGELSTGTTYIAEDNYLTVYTLENSNEKNLYVYHEDNGLVGQNAETGAQDINYTDEYTQYCTVGTIFIDHSSYGYYGNINGDIAEILVYDVVDEQLHLDVSTYMYGKYGIDLLPDCEDLGSYWETDLNQDCYIDLEDLLIMVGNWLVCNNPQDPVCTNTW